MDSTEIKIEKARKAIVHVLNRIRSDEKVRYYLGAGTESFEQLTGAYASLCDLPVDDVRNRYIPGSADLHRGDDE
jgi:hypothetical protein